MAIQRQDYLSEITNWLNRLELFVKGQVTLRHQDSLIELETFFRDVLNLVFGWSLQNDNLLTGANQDSFDLSDKANSLVVQVTVTTSAKKIRKTLNTFIGTHSHDYKRLVFIYPTISFSKSKADFSADLKGYDFDATRDRLGLNSILHEAQNLTIDKLGSLASLLRKELEPLGTSLPESTEISIGVRKRYSDWIREASSTFFVPGLNVSMSIEDAWVQLKVLKDDNTIIGVKSSLDEQLRNYLEFGQRTRGDNSGTTIATDLLPLTHSRFVIVGGPGDGKSTLLKRLAWRLADDSTIVVRVRLPIVLRHILAGRSFSEAIEIVGFDESGIDRATAAKMLNVADFLLCDGLDECDEHRTDISEHIVRWSIAHNQCRICVTTRPVGHESALLPEFTHFSIQPPGEDEVRKLSRKLFAKARPDEYLSKWVAFVEIINSQGETKHVHHLASRNPLLLGFLVRLTLDDVEIGNTRCELYSNIFDIIAKTTPNEREVHAFSERIAIEAANALAWMQTERPFSSRENILSFVSDHLRGKFQLDVLTADESATSALMFWENRRLVETLSAANHAKILFVHLSLQEFAAARYARSIIESEKFDKWIRNARRKPAYRQVILLLSGIDSDARTITALLRLDVPDDPISSEALLATDAAFEQDPPELSNLTALLDKLGSRLASDIPLLSIEAAQQLARLAPHAKQQVLDIACNHSLGSPWIELGSLLLRLLTDDDHDVVEEFKHWFQGFKPASKSIANFYPRNDAQTIPEEGRDVQNQIITLGVERFINDRELEEVAEYFHRLGDIGHLPASIVSNVQRQLTGCGLHTVASAISSPKFDIALLGRGFERWNEGKEALLRLIVRTSAPTSNASERPPFLNLSMFWAAIGASSSPGDWLTTCLDLKIHEESVAIEAFRALTAALELNGSDVASEAQAALNGLSNPAAPLLDFVANADVAPDWEKAVTCDTDVKMIEKGILHPVPYVCSICANVIAANPALFEDSPVIETALNTTNRFAIWAATMIAKDCLKENAFGVLYSRLEHPISRNHSSIFPALARICDEENQAKTINCFFKWLLTDDAEIATNVASTLSEFDPPLGKATVSELRKALAHWTERGSQCDQHGVVVGGYCTECHIVPPSPREAILRELDRLEVLGFDELVDLCDDARSDVSDAAKDILQQRAAQSHATFSTVLDYVKSNRLSPRLLDRLLKLPIEEGGPIAEKVETLLNSTDISLRLATISQLTGGWIESKKAVQYLTEATRDPEPSIRTLATRVLRLLS